MKVYAVDRLECVLASLLVLANVLIFAPVLLEGGYLPGATPSIP